MQRAVDKLITLLTKVQSSSQSSSVGHVRTGRHQFDSLIPNVRDNPCRGSENEQIRILRERQKEQILADFRAEIQKHEFHVDYDRRSIQKLNEAIESQRGEISRAHQSNEQLRRDQQILHAQVLEQNRDLLEAHEKSLTVMEELKRFQDLHTKQFRGENWSKIEILSLNSQARFRNYRMILIVKMIREMFKMLNQYAVDSPTLLVNQFFPTSSRSWWNVKPFSGNAEPQQWAAKYLGHTWYIGKRFLQIQRRLLQHLIRKNRIPGSLMYQNTHHHM